MKTLVIAPQPFFSARGTPFSVYYRTLIASELGYPADILTYGQGEDVDIEGCRIIRIPAFRRLGKVKTGPSALKLFLDVFMVVWTIALLLRHRYDLVHAHEESVFWCRWLKPLFGFRLIYDMHSSLPQQLDNFEFTQSRLVRWAFDWMERQAVHAADAVITICPALYDCARAITPDHHKVHLIENSVLDPVRLRSNVHNGSAKAHAAESVNCPQVQAWMGAAPVSHRIVYAGTLEAYQGIDILITAFAQARDTDPSIQLLVVGGQPVQVEEFKQLAAKLGIGDGICFTGQLSQPQAQALVSLCGVSVSPRCSGDNTPLKIYQLMATGMPILATRIDSHTQVLGDEICLLCDPSATGLADGLIFAAQNRTEMLARSRRAQCRYQEAYSREVYSAKMRALFESVR